MTSPQDKTERKRKFMNPYDISEEESDAIESEQIARMEKRDASKPCMFKWCGECTLIQGCYYQHGTRDLHPHFLTPECGEGPSKA